MEPTLEAIEPASTSSEPWPDPEDVRDWLGILDEGIRLIEAWRADVPSGDLHRVLSGACNDDEEMQRGSHEAAKLGLTYRQIMAANPPNLEIGRQSTRVQEVLGNPQHQDEDHGG